MATRALFSKLSTLSLLPSFTRSISTRYFSSSSSSLIRIRPLFVTADRLYLQRRPAISGGVSVRCMSTQPATSSLRDSSPNWSNRPPKETILLDGCDFEHWLVVMEPPPGPASNPDIPRDEIIDSYIKTLAMVVGSEEEARKKVYSVSTRHYFAFGALVSEELSYKIKELPNVRWVLPDSYLDVKNKDYGGEPFIDGQAVPYDPKYHEEWVRNNARANERSRRNDRPRNFDRSRNFERRRENMNNFQARPDGPPPPPPHNNAQAGPNISNMPPPPPPPSNNFNNMGGGPNMTNMPPPPPPPPGNSFNNNMPPHQQGGYMPPGGGPGYQGYQGGPGGSGYQRGGPGYPNPNAGSAGYRGGSPPGYQGGPPGGGYQGGNPNPPPPYQGGNPNPPPPYQGGNPNLPPPYQGGNPNPNPNLPYQGGGGGQGYQSGGGANYQQGGPGGYGYQGRDVPPGRGY